MKTDLKTIKDSFVMGFEAYEDSYFRADEIYRMAKGKMYTATQLRILRERGQPAEFFNIITLFNRSLQGYFSSVVNTMRAKSVDTANVENSNTINLGIEYTLRINQWDTVKDRMQKSGFNSGTMNIGYQVNGVGQDRFGRARNEIELEFIPYFELVRDPKARKVDYSDARFLHRFRWISEDEVLQLFPDIDMKMMNPYENGTGVDTADFQYMYNDRFTGRYAIADEYLIVYSQVVNSKGVTEEVWWSGDYEIKRQNLQFDSLRFSIRQVLLDQDFEEPEFSGIYSDVSESQKAINQAILQIQQLANGSKVLVENNAVDDIDAFETAWARVNSVIPINKIAGVEVIEFTRDIAAQYQIIDQALTRIQQVLHINDAFLGQAYSQDSGKKVALQKNSAMMALRYLSVFIDTTYRLVGLDITYLMRQFVDAEMDIEQDKREHTSETTWKTVNTPILDVKTGQPMSMMHLDANNKPVKKLINDPGSSFLFDRMDVEIESIPFDMDDTADKLMIDQTIQGPGGQLLMNAQPGEYAKMIALSTREKKTKNSAKIADIFDNMAKKMGALPWTDPRMMNQTPNGGVQGQQATGAGNISSAMGLDQNVTNQ